jgi:small GTP-binding protein
MRKLPFKVVMAGDAAVGKTSILAAYSGISANPDTYVPTIGAGSASHDFVVDGHSVTLEFWDTAGQEAFAPLMPLYARNARAAVLVATVDREPLIDSLLKWREYVMGASGDAAIVVAINKIDIAAPSDELQQRLAQHFATVIFVSALTGEGIRALFDEVAHAVMGRSPATDSHAMPAAPADKSCC